jgi:benzoyl-CoA-dihydrodiol lyase
MAQPASVEDTQVTSLVMFDTHPERYRHWKLTLEGTIATLALNVDEDGGLRSGYKLKLNSYDLGVDIELHDALQRIRFEHPQVRTVILTSARERVFCSGANIFMLGLSSHAWKVNFCKFTNETRNGIEDASRYSGLKFVAACNGTTAGGGYELALACDEIWLVDDRASAISLPEVPLLGVLPGTGGLTRLVDKRKVRRDHADMFCTTVEGVRAQRAQDWRLIDGSAKPRQFAAKVRERAQTLARSSDRPENVRGVDLTMLERRVNEHGYRYSLIDVRIDPTARTALVAIRAPHEPQPGEIDGILAQGAQWWPLAVVRELDDAILMLRTNHVDIGTWLLKTTGDINGMLEVDSTIARHSKHWFVREVIGFWRRTLARLEVTSRTLFALVDKGSCFAGTLLEIALAADRVYMLSAQGADAPKIAISELNFGAYPTIGQASRLAGRFHGEEALVSRARACVGRKLDTAEASALGLITSAPDELDWGEELRIAIEERTSLSPDALTGMEANLRFGGAETQETRIFGRLSAWQNWIFTRPNAVGKAGALKVFGTGHKPEFDWDRA